MVEEIMQISNPIMLWRLRVRDMKPQIEDKPTQADRTNNALHEKTKATSNIMNIPGDAARPTYNNRGGRGGQRGENRGGRGTSNTSGAP